MSKIIILASGSPRRKQLLESVGIPFEIIVKEIDETPIPRETGQAMVKRLALAKARAVLEIQPQGECVILAADTTVVSPKKRILGKPASETEAKKMIRELQGKTHFVFTGYALLVSKDGKIVRSISRVVRTNVKFKPMNSKLIDAYIARGESMDKAGAYGAQNYGMALIEKISGSYTNVVGLPIAEVERDLAKLKIIR